jgi:hypothetical protein
VNGAARPDDVRRRLSCYSLFEPRGQVGDVGRVESNGSAEVDGAELSTLDQALNRARVDVKEDRRLLRRQQRRRRRCHF